MVGEQRLEGDGVHLSGICEMLDKVIGLSAQIILDDILSRSIYKWLTKH